MAIPTASPVRRSRSGARIIFVADAFCAMTEQRPYAAARSVESSRQELRACSGTQFDPAVVTAFLAVLDASGARPGDHVSTAVAPIAGAGR